MLSTECCTRLLRRCVGVSPVGGALDRLLRCITEAGTDLMFRGYGARLLGQSLQLTVVSPLSSGHSRGAMAQSDCIQNQ